MPRAKIKKCDWCNEEIESWRHSFWDGRELCRDCYIKNERIKKIKSKFFCEEAKHDQWWYTFVCDYGSLTEIMKKCKKCGYFIILRESSKITQEELKTIFEIFLKYKE